MTRAALPSARPGRSACGPAPTRLDPGARRLAQRHVRFLSLYKRTKDGRGDGKAYRFFSELEALHGAASAHPTPVSLAPRAGSGSGGAGAGAARR